MSGLARERGTGNMNDVLIIGIAGGFGSGKTTLTNQIASQFQEHVTVLKHDNYYKAHDDMTYEDIAEVLDVAVGTLKATYHNAVKKIEESMRIADNCF